MVQGLIRLPYLRPNHLAIIARYIYSILIHKQQKNKESMLNVNDKLIAEIPNIGVDAFAIIQVLATFVNWRTQQAWPSLHTIRNKAKVMNSKGELKPMPRERAQLAIKTLVGKGFIERLQERPEQGKFGLVKYRIAPGLIGIYFDSSNAEFKQEDRNTESRTTDTHRNTETRDTDLPLTVIPSPNLLIDNIELINNNKERDARAKETKITYSSKNNKKEITPNSARPPKESKARPGSFAVLEEFINNYQQERNKCINENMANDFWDYYEANGWKVGRNQMRAWKAAARNWVRRQEQFTRKSDTAKSKNDRRSFTGASTESMNRAAQDGYTVYQY